MNIKNISQITEDTFSKLFHPIKSRYKVTVDTFSKLFLPITSRISEHRLAIRSLLNSKQSSENRSENRLTKLLALNSPKSSTISYKPLNFITIASILPFFLGFYDFINQNKQLKQLLFEKNIPAFSIPTESLNWDTFQYFNETKKDFLLGLEKVEWSTNSLFLTKKTNTQVFDQEYLIASFNNTIDKQSQSSFLLESDGLVDKSKADFKNPVFETGLIFDKDNANDNNLSLLSVNMQNFGSNRFYLYSLNKQPAVSFLQTFYLHLDEVPLKLDNLISYYTFSPLENKIVLNSDQQNSLTKLLPFHKNFWIEETKGIDFFSYQNSYFEKQTEKINSSDLLFQSEGFSKNEIPALSQFNTSKNPSEVDSKFFMKKQTSWFLQKIQYKTQNSIGSSFFQITPKNNFQRNDINNLESLNNLEELILELEKVLQEQDFSSLRRMSGYSYPDMNSKQVESFLIHNFFSYFPKNLGLSETTENSLKIIFPANPAFIKQYYFSNPKIPTKLSIKTGLVNFKDLDHKETLYNSVAVFLDSKNGLDWQLKESPFREGTPNMENESTSANSRSTHESVQNYRFFLENYFSPVNPLTHSALTYIKNDLKKIAFNSRTIFFSRDDIIIPFLTENEWKETYNQNKTASVLPSDYTVNGISLPINKITLPASKYNYARLNYTLNSTLDYRYSPQINTINPLSSSSSKLTPLILKGEFFTENFSPVNYKKLLSIFNQPNFLEISLFNKSAFIEKSFSDNWEPLSFGSWLLVSQIGIAYLFFNFIKSIISDYFNELIGFILDFGSALGIFDENIKQEIELATGQRDKGYRVLSDPKKKFQDIAGINTLLPEIAEIVWFLRNSGKEFAESKNIPRGLLLLGPPGTGKTALVQALAGEAKVPIVTLSGSSLIAPGESGALKLEILFQEARQLAPCIVFIDEIDSLAQKREGVMLNPMGGDEILSVLEPVNSSLDFGQLTSPDLSSQTSFFNKMESSLPTSSLQIQEDLNSSSSNKLALDIKQQMHAQEKYQHQQLTLLMQLLIELDGLQGRKGVIVVGATNRPELLDPAILRPGRFDKILELGLPSYKKRLEIMKLYGKIVSYDPNISWEYLSKRTVGYTAADLTSIMNQSSLKVIYNNKKIQHTLETIEHGIDRITTSNVEKPNRKIAPILVNRVAYYQAGKILLSTILEHHPPTLVSYLWQRRQNRRSIQILTNLQKYFFQFARRCELEHRIVGCYGGKAAEILFLLNSPVSLSTFGLEDLTFGFVLICFTIEKWYIYSKSTLLNQLTQIISNKNSKELIPEKIEIFKELASSMELSPYLLYSHEMDVSSYPFSQNFFSSAWWQLHISQQLEFVERHFADWYRLYLPNPEETELNIEWSPPDEFYHRNLLNKQINKNSSITWNDLHNIARDYQVHGFVLQSFNKALSIIDENREFLDKLVVELLKREVLRQTEIEKLASRFLPVKTMQESSTQNLPPIRIVNNSFGQMSRRKIKNWIDFKDFEN